MLRRYTSTPPWGLLALLALLLGGLSLMALLVLDDNFGTTVLGDPSALRTANQHTSSNTAIPQSYTPEEQAHYTTQIVAAFNCMRQQHGQSALQVDNALSAKAEEIWQAQAVDRSAAQQAAQHYPIVSVIALDWQQPTSGCSVGGYDVSQIPPVEATRIGVTVHAPVLPGGIDGASAVVLVGR